MRSSRVVDEIKLSLLMRSSFVVRASDSQWSSSLNSPGFGPSILRHSGIWVAADEAVFNIEHKKIKYKKSPFLISNSIDSRARKSSPGTTVLMADQCLALIYSLVVKASQGVTKRCRLSWLTNSARVYEPKSGGRGKGLQGRSQWVQL